MHHATPNRLRPRPDTARHRTAAPRKWTEVRKRQIAHRAGRAAISTPWAEMLFKSMGTLARSLALLATMALGAATRADDVTTLSHAPGPRPTADQVLDGNIPGRPTLATDTAETVRDEAGYARERLYHVPPVGEHPRVLFSRADLPRIRTQLEASETGRAMWKDWQRHADPAVDRTGWLSDAYAALAAGDGPKFGALWTDGRNPMHTGPPGGGANPLAQFLFFRSFAALLENDAKQGAELATAVATYATWLRPQIEAASKLPGAEHFWLQIRPVLGDSAVIGYLYDFTQPFMTEAQATTVRDLIVLCTRGRYGLGMDLPPHWRNWNFIGMGLYFPQLALAIEGEPGSDPRHIARGAEVARDYILHAITAAGLGKEGLGYHTAGFAHTTVLMLALANRGEHLFTLVRYRAMFDSWMLWTMQPWGRAWATNGDLGTFAPSPTLVQAARWLFPTDPRVALVAGQCAPIQGIASGPPENALLGLLTPAELGANYVTKTPPVFPADLPLALHDAERGVLFTRTGWTPDAVTVQLNARSDTTFPSHDHADRGEFLLNALGQAWSVPSMRETESQYHSVITIDGIGQGYFPTPATWVDVKESAAGTAATVDLKYCYDWRWMKSSFLATDEQLRAEPWLTWVRESRDRLLARTPRDRWERDPSPNVRTYYENWQAGDPRMWGEEDAWVLRSENVRVQKAYRSLVLVRGAAPFVIVADDIRRDDAEHLYEWRMILPMNVEAHDIKGSDIILGPVSSVHETKLRGDSAYKDTGRPIAPSGTPMLLVRILDIGRPRNAERTPTPAVETIEFVKHDDVHQFAGRSTGVGRRLVLPSRSVEPRYRVLLFPFHAGDKLPDTAWETPDILRVTATGSNRRVKFATAADGSPRLEILP